MSVATVVGMVVSIAPKGGEAYNEQNLEKTFLSFPDEKECEACLPIKMLMLDGYCACFTIGFSDNLTMIGVRRAERGRIKGLYGQKSSLGLQRSVVFPCVFAMRFFSFNDLHFMQINQDVLIDAIPLSEVSSPGPPAHYCPPTKWDRRKTLFSLLTTCLCP